VVAVRRVNIVGNRSADVSLNGIATSPDGNTIYVTVTGHPSQIQGGVLALPGFH
jgi:hypothetical protein